MNYLSLTVTVENGTIACQLTGATALAHFINELAYQIGPDAPAAHWQKKFRENLNEEAIRLLHDLVTASRKPEDA